MTKRDDRRHRFAIAMSAHRKLWARVAFNQLSKAAKFDKAHVRQIMRATSDDEAALKHIKTYFETRSRVYWASVLRTVWKTTGKEASRVANDLVTGKDFMRSLTGVALYGPQLKDGALEAASAGSSWDKVVEDKITGRDNKVVGITDETYRQVQKEMTDGHKEGLTHYEIGQNIDQHLTDSWANRGEAISRTEVNGAMNTAMLAEANQISPELNKVWSCTMSISSRQSHIDADGQSVPQDEPFDIEGEMMEEPGDDSASAENVVNCECTMFFEPPEDAPPGSEAPAEEITPPEELPPEVIPPEPVPAEGAVPNPLANDIPDKGFASTAKLNEWLVDNNIAEVSKLKGMDVDARLQIARGIKEVWEQNPELKAFREINNKSHGYPACVVYYTHTGQTDLGLSMKTLGNLAGRDAYFENISSTKWPTYREYAGQIERTLGKGVKVDSKTPFTVNGYGDKDKIMHNTVLHEMGHKLQRDGIGNEGWSAIYQANKKELLQKGSAYGGGIGARNAPAEGFAEANAAYRMGVTDRLPDAVVKYFDKIYGA